MQLFSAGDRRDHRDRRQRRHRLRRARRRLRRRRGGGVRVQKAERDRVGARNLRIEDLQIANLRDPKLRDLPKPRSAKFAEPIFAHPDLLIDSRQLEQRLVRAARRTRPAASMPLRGSQQVDPRLQLGAAGQERLQLGVGGGRDGRIGLQVGGLGQAAIGASGGRGGGTPAGCSSASRPIPSPVSSSSGRSVASWPRSSNQAFTRAGVAERLPDRHAAVLVEIGRRVARTP